MTRPRRSAAFVLFPLALLCVTVPAAAQDPDVVSRDRIAKLSAEERAALKDRHEAFQSLPEVERDRLRTLHGTLVEDGPGGPLNQTLNRLRGVLERLTPSERAVVESASTAEERVALLREVIDGYRRIPAPPRSREEWERGGLGGRSPLDWPRRDLIERELVGLLAERTSLLRLDGDAVLSLDRPERLLRVVGAAATERNSPRIKSPETWLTDDLLRDLDARLSAEELPGLGRWVGAEGEPREIAMGFARGQLIRILAEGLRDAWADRVAGPEGERLLNHLADLPDRELVRVAGGAARQDLAERLVRAREIEDGALAVSPEERAAAVEAFDLARRMTEGRGGLRRFGFGPGRRAEAPGRPHSGDGDRRPPGPPRERPRP